MPASNTQRHAHIHTYIRMIKLINQMPQKINVPGKPDFKRQQPISDARGDVILRLRYVGSPGPSPDYKFLPAHFPVSAESARRRRKSCGERPGLPAAWDASPVSVSGGYSVARLATRVWRCGRVGSNGHGPGTCSDFGIRSDFEDGGKSFGLNHSGKTG